MKRNLPKIVSDLTGAESIALPAVNDALRPLVANFLKAASDEFILPKFGKLQSADIDIKTGPLDLVTVADKDVELWLSPRLQDLLPGHCIGEEAVAEKPELRRYVDDGYAWSIDPIDGTNNFVNGLVDFCSMVALLWNGVPLQCWIWLPVQQTLYYAAAGAGAYCYSDSSTTPLHISQPSVDPLVMRGSGNTKGLKEPYKSLLEGKIPGEAVLVKKMLLDIINRTNYFEYIDPKKVIYFKESSDDPAGFEVEPLAPDIENIPDGKALKLTYSVRGKATLEKPFVRPSAKVNYIQMNESFKNELARLNKLGSSPAEDVFTILITKDELDKYERRLYEVLILKKLLDLNPDLELSLQYFRPGVEILFPSPGVLRQGPFVVDRQAARYFYEINSYYSAFDKEFNRQTAEIGRLLKNKK